MVVDHSGTRSAESKLHSVDPRRWPMEGKKNASQGKVTSNTAEATSARDVHGQPNRPPRGPQIYDQRRSKQQ